MNDRELAKAMRLIAECERRSGTAQPKTVEMLEQGAERLDRLRWRSVEEGLPDAGEKKVLVATASNNVWIEEDGVGGPYITHWRYATPPGAEGGGE